MSYQMRTADYGHQAIAGEEAALRREALVLEHLPQVRLIAGRIHDRLPDYISLDDLISTGVVGLLAAIDNFDASRSVQLKTYAEHRIHGAIMDSLRDMYWGTRETRKRSKNIEAAIHRTKQVFGREPAEEEIAADLGVPVEDYRSWLLEIKSVEIHRLDSVAADGESYNLLNVISDDEADWPSHVVERKELERIIALAIDRMPKNERVVLSLYYYEELTLREIAEVMGMHLSRIGQLRVQAILRLRSHLERVWTSPSKKR
jgi:RNA polymerase sigma factor for flagellar operon FliA